MTTDLLTIDEAAPIIGISACSLRLLIHAGKIRFMRIGPRNGRYRFKREWLVEYLESCISEPTSKPSQQPATVPISRSSRARAVVEVQSQKDRLKAFKQELRKRG